MSITLKEVKEYCNKYEDCDNCGLKDFNSGDKIEDGYLRACDEIIEIIQSRSKE